MDEVRKAIMIPNRKVKDSQAAMFLETLGICQALKYLPSPGGLYDQDSLFVYVMKFALVWQNERRELDQKTANRNNKAPARSARRR